MADVARMRHTVCVPVATASLAKEVFRDVDFLELESHEEALEAFHGQRCRAVLTDQTVLQQWRSDASECSLNQVRARRRYNRYLFKRQTTNRRCAADAGGPLKVKSEGSFSWPLTVLTSRRSCYCV